MYPLSNLVVILLFLLSSSHKISLVAASTSERSAIHDSGISGGKFGPVKHAHFEPGNTERNFLHVQSLHSDSEAELNGNVNQISEEFDSTPTPSHPVVRPEDEDDNSSPLSMTLTDASPPPNVASRTIPVRSPSHEMQSEDHPATPFDHYHILGTRTGSSDSTLEKRRVCPAQPLPSNRGCTCPNQTICKMKNHRTCVQLNHDHENCGACSLRCGTTQYCEGGKCHCERPNFSVCGKSCYNLKNNEEHCGKCGVVCGRGKTCIKGACKRA